MISTCRHGFQLAKCEHILSTYLHNIVDDPNGAVTTIQAGSTFNVTYYLSYPHRVRLCAVCNYYTLTFRITLLLCTQGGIRFNILNSTGHVIYALLGIQEPFVNSEDIV